jgi:deaminated glutathione amidase
MFVSKLGAAAAVACLVVGLMAMKPAAAQEEGSAMKDTKLRLGLMRAVPEKWNVEANFEVFLELLEQADEGAADVFITPECWLDGYASPEKSSTPEKLRTIAQELNTSAYLKRVSAEAKKREMYICFGFTSLEGDKIYNASVLYDRGGERIAVYHKVHLQKHDLQYAPGEGLPVWSTEWGPVGIMICADRRWPETTRSLRLQGAKLILNPTYGFYGDFNEAMMRTRAFENQCFIAFTHPKESLVTGPKGQVLAKETDTGVGVLFCDIDLADAKDDNHLRDRRPKIYGVITDGE